MDTCVVPSRSRALGELALVGLALGCVATWLHGRPGGTHVDTRTLLLTGALLVACWVVESARVPVGLDRVGRVRTMSGINALLLPAAVLLPPVLYAIVAVGSALPLARTGMSGAAREALIRLAQMSAAAIAFHILNPAGAQFATAGDWASTREVLGLVLAAGAMLVVESLCIVLSLRRGEGLLAEDVPWLSARDLAADSPEVAIGALACVLLAAPAALVLLVPLFVLENQMLRAHAAQLRGYRDAKTGLLTLTAFHDLAARELSRARRTGQPVSVLMIDLDGLKALNSALGHLAGDRAIEALAGLLRDSCREEDLVCRFGGDEFCLLLPGAGQEQAALVGERIRVASRATEVRELGRGSTLSVSVGVAVVHDADDVVAVLDRADAGLRGAKGSGGNRVRVVRPSGV